MAVMGTTDRQAVTDQFQRENTVVISGALTKAQLRAAIDAADAWVDSNAASYNTALPLPARTVLTAGQKALILVYVVTRRWILGL
jgi:hypothetical protein